MIRQEHIGDSIQSIMSRLVGRAHQRARHIARKLQLQVVGMIADTGCNPVRRTQHPSELLCGTALPPTSTITSLVPVSPPCRLARLVRMQQRRMAPSDYWHKLSGRWAAKPSVGFGSVAVELKRTWGLSRFWVSSLAAEVAVIPHPPTLFTWSMPRTAARPRKATLLSFVITPVTDTTYPSLLPRPCACLILSLFPRLPACQLGQGPHQQGDVTTTACLVALELCAAFARLNSLSYQ